MQEFVDQAEIIHTDGRWKRLNEAIEGFAVSIPKNDMWKVDVFPNLSFNLLNEYIHLKDGFHGDDSGSPIVVWHARNLLEISIWVLFCLTSEENERRFYEDSIVDAYDLIARAKKLYPQNSSLSKNYESALLNLEHQAASQNIHEIDRKYLSVSKIAKKLNIKENFDFQNKFLSKYVHPSALQIVSPHLYKAVRLQAFHFGCLNFVNAFPLLESYFMSGRSAQTVGVNED
ncbi:MAG: DUF5677 domain-containing protein [Thalassospira sp.]|uniref:DUF5677 domain-containing protein n=1 Tax=Thalassospira sp. TaxID=1912094 RepID=UPI0032EBEEC3